MRELVLVDSGEHEAIRRYADYLVGINPGEFTKDVPFTLVCGICLAVASAIFAPIFFGFYGTDWEAMYFSQGLASAVMILVGSVPLITKRRESKGFYLSVCGLGLSGILVSLGLL